MPKKNRLVVVGILIATLLLGFSLLRFTPLGFLLIPLQQNPGFFYRPHFDSIVQAVRASGLSPGQVREFHLTNLWDARTLRPLPPDARIQPGQGAGHVWAERTPDGALKVVIETNDMGHAGEYGFAYSETPLEPEPFDGTGDWFTLALPGHLGIVKLDWRISDHWWRVCFNLG